MEVEVKEPTMKKEDDETGRQSSTVSSNGRRDERSVPSKAKKEKEKEDKERLNSQRHCQSKSKKIEEDEVDKLPSKNKN